MRIFAAAFVVLTIFCLALAIPNLFGIEQSFGDNAYPDYAKVGAFAFYSGDGGYIAFLSGVSGNISYYVTNVYSNYSMRIFVNANLSLGTEVTTNVSMVSENLTDSIFAPKILPAVPVQNLTMSNIIFQNINCTFLANNDQFNVPAGNFNATEFQGKDANGTSLYFWFDRSSGLAIEMLEAGSYFQLINSNIAIPSSTQSSFLAELPFILIFVVGWAAAGLLFYSVRRHYLKKSQVEGFGQTKDVVSDGRNQKKTSKND